METNRGTRFSLTGDETCAAPDDGSLIFWRYNLLLFPQNNFPNHNKRPLTLPPPLPVYLQFIALQSVERCNKEVVVRGGGGLFYKG